MNKPNKPSYVLDKAVPFTQADAAALRRLEVRLTKLMYHLGIDEYGKTLRPMPPPLNKPNREE